MNAGKSHPYSWRALRVWRRNLTVYRRTWKVSFLPPLLEPLLYIVAFGVGLSAMIAAVSYGGRECSYLEFVAPALIAVSIMNSGFFETTYGSFVRMYYQKTFDAMLATPLSIEDVIAGEILWGATKALISATLMMAVVTGFGLLSYPGSLWIPPVALLAGFTFSSVGMWFTGITPNIEMFNLPSFLFITPMFLFGGTFFPLEQLPGWAQHVAWCLPLTHLVRLVRDCGLGQAGTGALVSAGYLGGLGLIAFFMAQRTMRRRLIV